MRDGVKVVSGQPSALLGPHQLQGDAVAGRQPAC